MKPLWSCAALAALCLVPWARADEPPKPEAKSFEVPYRLTAVKHIVVRAKINGKGPFNFILDTGAPALFIAPEAAKKAGVEPDAKGWGVFDKLRDRGRRGAAQGQGPHRKAVPAGRHERPRPRRRRAARHDRLQHPGPLPHGDRLHQGQDGVDADPRLRAEGADGPRRQCQAARPAAWRSWARS